MYHPKFEKRTDLAIEVRESFPQDNVEIDGVALYEDAYENGSIQMTTVEIRNEKGAMQMKKPIGTYVTLEFSKDAAVYADSGNETLERYSVYISQILKKIVMEIEQEDALSCHSILVSGLGNRFATPDALGPYVLEHISMNRHVEEKKQTNDGSVALCGISPGVMSQTGMETSEILEGIIRKVKPDVLLVIDSLAARSVNRLCRTIQITNTGISPGAGIGNNRNRITRETMGIPVVAIGVPTVVDAGTIIYESLERALAKEGYREDEIHSFYRSIATREVQNLFVTPKDIDEEIRLIGELIASGIQKIA